MFERSLRQLQFGCECRNVSEGDDTLAGSEFVGNVASCVRADAPAHVAAGQEQNAVIDDTGYIETEHATKPAVNKTAIGAEALDGGDATFAATGPVGQSTAKIVSHEEFGPDGEREELAVRRDGAGRMINALFVGELNGKVSVRRQVIRKAEFQVVTEEGRATTNGVVHAEAIGPFGAAVSAVINVEVPEDKVND